MSLFSLSLSRNPVQSSFCLVRSNSRATRQTFASNIYSTSRIRSLSTTISVSRAAKQNVISLNLKFRGSLIDRRLFKGSVKLVKRTATQVSAIQASSFINKLNLLKGHDIREFSMKHKPSWACCDCFKTKECCFHQEDAV